jgi:transcriptional regulator with XRE-family HTH domain
MKKSVHTAEYRVLRAQLRQARDAAGLSQRELAARLQVPHSWVAKVEAGERRLDFVEFCWFATACGSNPAKFAAEIVSRFNAAPSASRKGRSP